MKPRLNIGMSHITTHHVFPEQMIYVRWDYKDHFLLGWFYPEVGWRVLLQEVRRMKKQIKKDLDDQAVKESEK